MDMRGAYRRNTVAEALSWPLTSSTALTNTCSYTSILPIPPWCARSQFHCITTTTTVITTAATATTKRSGRAPCQYSNYLRDGRVRFSSNLRQMWLLARSENITRQPTMKSYFELSNLKHRLAKFEEWFRQTLRQYLTLHTYSNEYGT